MIKRFMNTASPLGCIALVAAVLGSIIFSPTEVQARRNAKITYVSHESVYLAAGSSSGLSIGDTLRVKRGKKVVGAVVVTSISTRSAACSVIDIYAGLFPVRMTAIAIRAGVGIARDDSFVRVVHCCLVVLVTAQTGE